MSDKYCPKHKYIEPKCLDCLTRWARELNSRNVLLEDVWDAASYCFRHGYIDHGAVLFTDLEKKLAALNLGNGGRGE